MKAWRLSYRNCCAGCSTRRITRRLALGAFESEGVEVRFVSAPRLALRPTGLFAGTADAAWGGPMRVNQLYEARHDCDVVCFGEAVTRDPFFLVGREPCPNFASADL